MWKLFHYLVYVAGVGTFVHGILADPELKGNAVDPADGEKLFVESCLLVVVLTTVWAWRYRRQKDREERCLKCERLIRIYRQPRPTSRRHHEPNTHFLGLTARGA